MVHGCWIAGIVKITCNVLNCSVGVDFCHITIFRACTDTPEDPSTLSCTSAQGYTSLKTWLQDCCFQRHQYFLGTCEVLPTGLGDRRVVLVGTGSTARFSSRPCQNPVQLLLGRATRTCTCCSSPVTEDVPPRRDRSIHGVYPCTPPP